MSHPNAADQKSFASSFLRWRQRKGIANRTETRHECVIIATMTVVEIGVPVEGMVMELSRGGLLFRPASLFILDRTGELVSIKSDAFTTTGTIRNVRPAGYGIQIYTRFAEDLFQRLLTEYASRPDNPAALHPAVTSPAA